MNPMMVADARARLTPGDFGAFVFEDRLHVPPSLCESLRRLGLCSVEDFVTYANAFPSALADELGWRIEDLDRARMTLIASLRGHVRSEILSPSDPPKFGYGALDPRHIG